MVLEPYIEERLKQYVPRVSSYVSSIDPPYFFSDDVRPEPFADDVIRFGSHGIGSLEKGTDIFFSLAEEVQSAKTTYKPTFTLIGYIDKRMKDAPHRPVNILSPDVPLDQEAMKSIADVSITPSSFTGRTLTNYGRVVQFSMRSRF